jgi:hypothetical protein
VRKESLLELPEVLLSGEAAVGDEELLEALFGTRVLVRISGDNPLEYWVKPLPSPNSHKTLPTIH